MATIQPKRNGEGWGRNEQAQGSWGKWEGEDGDETLCGFLRVRGSSLGFETEKILPTQPEGDGEAPGLQPGLSVPSSGCRDTLWPAEGGVHPVGPLPLRAVRCLPALHAPALTARLLPAATRRGPDTQRRRSRPRPLPNLRDQGLRFFTLGKNKWTKGG